MMLRLLDADRNDLLSTELMLFPITVAKIGINHSLLSQIAVFLSKHICWHIFAGVVNNCLLAQQ